MKGQNIFMTGLTILTCASAAGKNLPNQEATKANSDNIEKRKPNVLFIMADQWRKQALGYMHQDPVQTPNLDALASNAVSFDNTVSNNPVSGPNRACMFTGRYTINNGLWANGTCVDTEATSAMGRIFKEAGYSTGYIGKWHMNGIDDVVRDPSRRLGFDYWYQSIAHNHFKGRYYIPEESDDLVVKEGWGPTIETNVAIDYIKNHKEDPFCLVVSYAPPHTGGGVGYEDRYQPGKKMRLGYGYAGPKEFEEIYQDNDYTNNLIRPNVKPTGHFEGTQDYAHAVPGYFGAVTAIDHEIGRLIKHLEEEGLLENTIVVFTADHGEMMGSQGLMTKGVPFEESEGVPMLFSWKGNINPARHECVFSSIDIIPTLASLAGLKATGADGQDYSPLIFGKKFKEPEYVFTEFNFGGIGEKGRPWRAVFSEDYVYIIAGPSRLRNEFVTEGYVLYDRKNDPYQMNPITKGMGYDKIIKKYHKILEKHIREMNDPFLDKMWNPENGKLPCMLNVKKPVFDPNLTEKGLKRKIRDGYDPITVETIININENCRTN